MSEHQNPSTDPATSPDPDPDPSAAADAAPVTPARTRLRDRALGFRGVVAVAAAGLILGGLAGTTLGFVLDDGHHARPGMGGPAHHGGFDGERGMPPLPPGGAPEGVPPVTPPESDGGDSSS